MLAFITISNLILLKVLVPKNENLMGKMVTVRIVETGKHFLKGQLLSDKDIVQPDVPLPLKKGQVSGASGLVQVCKQCCNSKIKLTQLTRKTKMLIFLFFANKRFYSQILALLVDVPFNHSI